MDSHGIRAGWPFDRRVDFPLGKRLQLKAGAVGKEGGPGESPGKRMNGWRRMGWKNEDETTGAERASVGRRLPAEGAPIVIDLDVSSGYPIVLGQVDGRTMIRWPLTVRERPPSPHRTMFSDEYHHDADGWLHRDGGPRHRVLQRRQGVDGTRRPPPGRRPGNRGGPHIGLVPARPPDRAPGIGPHSRTEFTGAIRESKPMRELSTLHTPAMKTPRMKTSKGGPENVRRSLAAVVMHRHPLRHPRDTGRGHTRRKPGVAATPPGIYTHSQAGYINFVEVRK